MKGNPLKAIRHHAYGSPDVLEVQDVGMPALQALRDKGRIRPGHKVPVNGAAGGVGTFAVQDLVCIGGGAADWAGRSQVWGVRSL